MENVSEGHIASDDHRLTFAKIREKLANAEDFDGELRSLYKVQGLGEFALSLMWVAERAEADPGKLEYDAAEQGLVLDRFREAVGDVAPAPLGDLTPPAVSEVSSEPSAFEQPQAAEAESVFQEPPAEAVSETPVEETVEMPAQLQMETPGRIDESEKGVYAPPTAVDESAFGPLVERFVEAMQSGSEERDGLLNQVVLQANAVAAPGSGGSDDLREFCQYLIEFLNYIKENGFMDDVRVMNILSNVSTPVSSWAQASPDARAGLLGEGTEILKTFKSLFE